MRGGADGNGLDIAPAGLLNGAAGDQALAVGQQDDLEHDAGVIPRWHLPRRF